MPEDPLGPLTGIDPTLAKHVSSEDDWAFEDGILPKKTKLLIALAYDAANGATHGARVLAEWAIKTGASREEIGEALRVAYVMSGRGSIFIAAHALRGLFPEAPLQE